MKAFDILSLHVLRFYTLILGGFKYFEAWKYINGKIEEYLTDGRIVEEEVPTIWRNTVKRIKKGLTIQGVKSRATEDMNRFSRKRTGKE